jgi:hypothetical protein
MEENNMDKLFKNGLKNPEMPFEEADWIAMEKKLDAKKAKKVRFIWIAALSAAAAVILTFFIAIWLPTSFNKPHVDVVKKQDSVKRKISPQIPALPSTKQATIQVDSMDRGLFAEQQSVEPLEQELNGHPDKNYDLLYRDTLLAQVQAKSYTLGSANEFNLTPAYTERISRPVMEPSKEKILNREQNKSSYLTILVAPDLTSVQGAGNQQFSPNIGVLYTKSLSKKLSISGGLLYARKNYNSPFSFYKPKIQRDYGVTPSQVDAACDVLDVPIEFNYQIFNKGTTKIKVSAGASSYFMLREQYRFSYNTKDAYGAKNTYNSSMPSTYEVKGENNHLLGVASLSATFEHQINNNTVIGIRPFIKLPLTGIGYGQTKLESKGLAVSVSFKLGK